MEGPETKIGIEIDTMKYRQNGESFREKCSRIADALKDSEEHFKEFRDILLDQRFLPAGRIQAAMGAAKVVTPANCFVMDTIPDSMDGIMEIAKEAAQTMRLGGGVGYDFSTLRPKGDRINGTDSPSSGPVSFMQIFDSVCKTIMSAGVRRGAQMGVLRIDHPDVEEFIRAKQNSTNLTQFNVSLAVTDRFMDAVKADLPFDLVWGGRVYKTVSAKNLWNEVMRSTWNWAEPGVLFIDRINRDNNLFYYETIAATNPCAEQPLPPNGACLLGSFNLTKYLFAVPERDGGAFHLDLAQLILDIPPVIRAMDNVIDRGVYPLERQRRNHLSTRRMGIGLTGVANALEITGAPYGSKFFLESLEEILKILVEESYKASALLSDEKEPFPLFSSKDFLSGSTFAGRLPEEIKKLIVQKGIRNSHLISIAPTGTISLTADNISSGIEPVFLHEYNRTVQTADGPAIEKVQDYAFREFGVKGKTANECTPEEHLSVLLLAQKYCDSSVSKTCNIGPDVLFSDFKKVYEMAYDGGAKGCTTFRSAGMRFGILNEAAPSAPQEGEDGAACYIDLETGKKTCE